MMDCHNFATLAPLSAQLVHLISVASHVTLVRCIGCSPAAQTDASVLSPTISPLLTTFAISANTPA